MAYNWGNVFEYILDLTDKKGSDLHQEPDVLNAFKTATNDFLRAHTKIIEDTQRVSQDLQKLMITRSETVIDNPDNVYTVICQIPSNCFFLSGVLPKFKGNVVSRRPKLIRHGDRSALTTDPHNKPTPEYAISTQYIDTVEIDSGYNEKAIGAYLTYLKKPTYANLGEHEKQVVDLPGDVIEDLIIKTSDILLGIVGDPRVQVSGRREQTFGNVNR